jgi:CubicO group peptidase (beta-lactamase class C family)
VITAVAIVSSITLIVFWKVHSAASGKQPSGESVAARVDQLFAQWNRSDSPGCSLGVSKHGVPVYERGYGMANLELEVSITPAAVFPAASISKQFTAMSILLLAQRGQLSLDDEVRKYIPEWVDHGSGITIRHLLTHTSGLRDAFMLEGLAPVWSHTNRDSARFVSVNHARIFGAGGFTAGPFRFSAQPFW